MVKQEAVSTGQSIIPSLGDIAKGGVDAFVTAIPGRKIVSAARAELKVERIVTEGINELEADARRHGWSDEFLAMRVQGFVKGVGRRVNLGAVARRAQDALGDDRKLDPDAVAHIDSEWLNYFMDHAERITDNEVRQVWGAILAGEANRGGTYSKQAMSILSKMGRRDIKAFRTLCLFIMDPIVDGGPSALAMKVDEGLTTYNKGILTYDQLSGLCAFGLVDGSGESMIRGGTAAFRIDGQTAIIQPKGGNGDLTFGPIFTHAGNELSRLCTDRDADAIKAVLAKREEKGEISVQWAAASS